MTSDDMIIVLVCSLGAAVAWGVADYFAARSTRAVGTSLATALVNALGAIGFLVFCLATIRQYPVIDQTGVMYAVASGVFMSIGSAMFFRGLDRGPVSIVSPLSSVYPLVTTGLAVAVFGARISILQGVGIGLVIFGVLVASGILSAKRAERKMAAGPRYALAAALAWGLAFTLLAQGIYALGWQVAGVIEAVASAVALLLMLPIIKGKEVINIKTIRAAAVNRYVIGAAAAQVFGLLLVNFGLSKEASSGAIVAALSACYPILTVFLVFKHMEEKLVLIPLIGAFVGVAGVIVLTLG